MDEKHPAINASTQEKKTSDARFCVYGLNIVAKMWENPPTNKEIYCPKGHPIQYGIVISRGDGFDPQANTFRELPPLGAVVAFEESPEGVEGHYFFIGEDEYRVLHLEALNIAFPPQE